MWYEEGGESRRKKSVEREGRIVGDYKEGPRAKRIFFLSLCAWKLFCCRKDKESCLTD